MSEQASIRRWPAGLAAALLALHPGPVAAQDADAPAPSYEYFVRQAADQPLVIRVNPFEAEFRARVTGPKGEVLRDAALPGNRSLPLFLFIDGAGEERQLDIRVDAAWHTRATRFDLEFSRLDVRDDLSMQLARAYQLLSFGQESLSAQSAANWSVKVNLLAQAGEAFRSLGMEELRLQGLLSAAHLAHFELGDDLAAQEYLAGVIEVARLAGLPRTRLAALMLQGGLLAGQAIGPGDPEASSRALGVLAEARDLAAELGWKFEQAYAGYLAGQVLAGRDDLDPALQQFQAALDIALDRQAMALSTDIRERMVEVHDRLGDMVAKEAELGNVVDQLARGGAQAELVKNLLEQAALYMGLYRYPEAVGSLQRALAVDDNSLTRTQAQVMLGLALYENGQLDPAADTLGAALVNPSTDVFRRPSALLPLGAGLGALAGIHRQRGDFAEAQRVRRIQGRHLQEAGERAEWAYQRVLDLLAARDPAAALQAWRDGQALFAAADQYGALAQLALCAARADGAPCREADVRQAAAAVARDGDLRGRLAADRYQARIAALGRSPEAARRYAALLADLHFLQAELPGVAGAWFWQNREALFAEAIGAGGTEEASEAADSLLTLARVLHIGRAAGDGPAVDALRADIRAARGNGSEPLARARAEFERRFAALSAEGLQRFLQSLGRDESVLAIDLDGRSGQAWVATRQGVRRSQFRLPAEVAADLARLRSAAASGAFPEDALKRAGRALFDPLRDDLAQTVYILPTGSVLGLPLAEMGLDGAPLGRQHRLVLLGSFPLAPGPAARLSIGPPENVFLAADPVDWTPAYPERLQLAPEAAAVTGQFVGPGLHGVLANALLADEFSDPRLRQADLIHLAVPGRLDLGDSQASFLELSEPGRGAGRDRLVPAQIRLWALSARLAVLSRVPVWERAPGRFDSRTGLADDLLDAGAVAVLLAGAGKTPTDAATFAHDFYAELAGGGNIAAALAAVRQRAPRAAAGCSLYLR